MRRHVTGWKDFWKYENPTVKSITKLNMDIFIKSTMPILNYNSKDVVMDIGCGDCQLASELKDKVKEIHCLDISEHYLIQGKKKFSQHKNIFFYKLDEKNYTDLSIIKRNSTFTKIICLSVVQYYEESKELEKLITEIRKLATPGATLLIADIPTTGLSCLDVFFFLKVALEKNHLFPAIIHLIKGRLSSYHSLYKKVGLQCYSTKDIENVILKHNLNAKILNNKITINKRRIHLLVNF